MEDLQAVPIRFPRLLYDRLRKAAFDQRMPMTQIVIAAVEKELRHEQEQE